MRFAFLLLTALGLMAIAPPGLAQSPPGCGDGVRAAAEQCDDDNTFALDGCDSACRFEQTHRANSMTWQFAADAACANNRFGGAFVGSIARDSLQNSLTTSIADGSTTVMLHALGLEDLSGAQDADVSLGVLTGTPVPAGATPYNGANDLDWWYAPSATDVADLAPVQRLSASFISSALVTAPGAFALPVSVAGVPARLAFWETTLDADVGPSSTPLVSSGEPPGHVPAENLDPTLQSFATLAGGVMCGKMDAKSLRDIPMPAALTGCTFGRCSQCYTPSNTFLDLMVGGCSILGIAQVAATQPDTFVAAAPAAGGGAPYTFVRTGNAVTGCLAQGTVAPLADCLRAAAYSTYLRFTTDRVILRTPSPLVFADGFEG